MIDLRCSHLLHGILTDEGLFEVSCKSRWCGKEPGIVVLHRFDPRTGKLVETLKYKTPMKPNKKG